MPSAVAGFVISGLGGATALGVIGVAAVNIGVGLAFSAVGQMLFQQDSYDAASQGIQTKSTTAGETSGQRIVVGTYATAGHLNAPRYSHRADGTAGSGSYRTNIIALSDMPLDASALTKATVDGVEVSIDGAVHADYGTSPSDGKYAGKIWFKFYDGTQTTADPMLVAKYGSHDTRPWTSSHIGRNTAYVIVTQLFDAELWRGETGFLFEIARGIPLYDMSKDTSRGGSGSHRWETPSTWEHSSNPQVIKMNVALGIDCKNGKKFGGQYDIEDLPAYNWIPAIQACDVERSSLQFDYNIARFSAGFEVNLGPTKFGGTDPATVVEEMDRACNGATTDMGGTLYTRVGAPQLPVKFLTDDDILVSSPQQYTPFSGVENTINAISATYPSIKAGFNTKETKEKRDEGSIGSVGYYPATVNLRAVVNESQAQDVCEGLLANSLRDLSHSVTLPPEYITLNVLDALDWQSDYNGYTGKDFEIQEMAIDPATLSVTLAMRETDPNDSGLVELNETPSTAPSTIPLFFQSEAVPAWSALGVFVADGVGTPRRPAGLLSWGPLEADVVGIKYRVRVTDTGDIVDQNNISDLEVQQHIVTAGLVGSTDYEAQGKLIANRPTEWTGWVGFTTPNVGFSQDDFDQSVQESLARVDLITTEVRESGRRNVLEAINQLDQMIEASEGADAIRTRHSVEVIDRTTQGEAFLSITETLAAQTAGNASGLLSEAVVRSAAISSEAIVRADADSAQATLIDSLTARTTDAESGLVIAQADITDLATVKVDALGAIAAVETTISAQYGSLGAMATATSFSEAGVSGMFAGYIWRARAGGASGEVELIAADSVAGGSSSQFKVSADRFVFLGKSADFFSDVSIDGDLIVDGTITTAGIELGAVSITENKFLNASKITSSPTYSVINESITRTAGYVTRVQVFVYISGVDCNTNGGTADFSIFLTKDGSSPLALFFEDITALATTRYARAGVRSFEYIDTDTSGGTVNYVLSVQPISAGFTSVLDRSITLTQFKR